MPDPRPRPAYPQACVVCVVMFVLPLFCTAIEKEVAARYPVKILVTLCAGADSTLPSRRTRRWCAELRRGRPSCRDKAPSSGQRSSPCHPSGLSLSSSSHWLRSLSLSLSLQCGVLIKTTFRGVGACYMYPA